MTETKELTTSTGREVLAGDLLAQAGQAANRAAARHVFTEYRARKAENTRRRQDAGLALFKSYLLDLAERGGDNRELRALADALKGRDFSGDPQAWAGVTWGLVAGFVKWMLGEGYAVGSVNVRLSTVKTYAKLAAQAGALDRGEYAMIRAVSGYRHGEAANIDATRKEAGLETRTGDKKAEPVHVGDRQAQRLKTEHASDGQGRRDRLIMCLLCDWGPRVSELAALTVGDVGLDSLCPTLHLHRRKVKGTAAEHAQLDLTTSPDTLDALRAYLEGNGAPSEGALLLGSTKRGNLTSKGMSTRAIRARVRSIGRRVLGLENLTPHDLRHYAATYWGPRLGTKRLMDIFGWSSPAMAVRYQESAKVIGLSRSNADYPN